MEKTKRKPERRRQPIEPKSEIELIHSTIKTYDWAYDPHDKFVLPMWGLACQLSRYPSLRGQDADDIADIVQAICPFRNFPGVDSDEDEQGRDQFISCWQSLKPGPLGKDAYVIALSEANEKLLPVHRAGGHDSTKQFTKVVNFVYRLQIAEGENPFLLSARALADVIGICYTNAAPYINRLIFEKFIEVVEKPRKAQQRAGRYRFIGRLENGAIVPGPLSSL